MKKILLVAFLFVSTVSWAKPKPEDYTVNVHVKSSEIVPGYANRVERLEVVIDGKKFLLDRTFGTYDLETRPLIPGDYKAKLVEEQPDPDNPVPSYEYHQKYEFLLPDGKTRKYTVFGASE